MQTATQSMGTQSIDEDKKPEHEATSVADIVNGDFSPVYQTEFGAAFQGDSEELLKKLPENSIDLIVTSPPFALQKEKDYGNKDQESYNEWFMNFVPLVRRVLQPHGSFVVEIGGAFKKGMPERSLYQWELLQEIVEDGDLRFVQDWYWYNPNTMPGPTEWVNVKKLRGVPAVTQIWWLSKELNKETAYTDELQDKVETIETLRDNYGSEISDEDFVDVALAILSGEAKLPDSNGSADQKTLNLADNDSTFENNCRSVTVDGIRALLNDVSSVDANTWSNEEGIDSKKVREILGHIKSSDSKYDDKVRDVLAEKLSPYWALYVHSLILGTNKAPRTYKNKVISHIESGEYIRRPYPKPESHIQRNKKVLNAYSDSHEQLIESGEYNDGKRGSGHNVGENSFTNDNGGSIKKNLIEAANTASNTPYQTKCEDYHIKKHSARFVPDVPEFFINLLTPDPPYDNWDRGEIGCPGYLDRPIVLDIFSGSNYTGKIAEDNERYWLSFEQNEEYAQTSELRFLNDEETKQRFSNPDAPIQQFRYALIQGEVSVDDDLFGIADDSVKVKITLYDDEGNKETTKIDINKSDGSESYKFDNEAKKNNSFKVKDLTKIGDSRVELKVVDIGKDKKIDEINDAISINSPINIDLDLITQGDNRWSQTIDFVISIDNNK